MWECSLLHRPGCFPGSFRASFVANLVFVMIHCGPCHDSGDEGQSAQTSRGRSEAVAMRAHRLEAAQPLPPSGARSAHSESAAGCGRHLAVGGAPLRPPLRPQEEPHLRAPYPTRPPREAVGNDDGSEPELILRQIELEEETAAYAGTRGALSLRLRPGQRPSAVREQAALFSRPAAGSWERPLPSKQNSFMQQVVFPIAALLLT